MWLRTYAAADRALIEVEDECGGLPAGVADALLSPTGNAVQAGVVSVRNCGSRSASLKRAAAPSPRGMSPASDASSRSSCLSPPRRRRSLLRLAVAKCGMSEKKPDAKPPRPERDETDQSLRTERKNTDEALAERRARLEESADAIEERARDHADAVLDSARA